MNYYFLASSLPTLSMDSAPEITFEEFAETCEAHLTEHDMRAVRSMSDPESAGEHDHPFIKAWEQKEIVLKNTLTKLRAIKLNVDASVYMHDTDYSDTYAEKVVTDAYTHGSPLDREETIDKFRWAQAEELGGFNPFSCEAILAYGLKLKIAERWGALDLEKAQASADLIINKNPEEKE